MMRKIILLIAVFVFSTIAFSQDSTEFNLEARLFNPLTAPKDPKELKEVSKKVLIRPFDTEYNYFDENSQMLDEYITKEWETDFSHVVFEKRFSGSGALIEVTHNLYWQQSNSTGQYRNKLSQKDLFDTQSADGAPRIKSRLMCHYTPQGYLMKESFAVITGEKRAAAPQLLQAIEYTYDNNGNVLTRTIKNRTGTSLAVTRYTYTGGRMTRSETVGPDQKVISSTVYSYDSSGNLTKQEVRDSENKISSVVTSTWRNIQNSWKETSNVITGPDGQTQLRISYEYKNTGDLAKKIIENIEGESVQYIHYDFARRRS